jgi:PQQ-dependent dehydrogenase (methanol/ethanol family)
LARLSVPVGAHVKVTPQKGDLMSDSPRIAPAALLLALVACVHCGLGRAAGPTVTTSPSNANDSEWPLEGRDSDNDFYSPLSDINDKNVSQLGLAWSADLPSEDGAVGTPQVADGVVYQSFIFSRVVANDLRTGKVLWEFRPQIHYSGKLERHYGIVNRGVALWKDKVYVNTSDCRLIAIDRKTGKQAWAADVCTENKDLTLSSMPHVGEGVIYVGTSNGDAGTSRCHLSAFDAETGKRRWRFYTFPGDPGEDAASADPEAMRMASKTWGKGYTPAGGCPWDSVVYDPKLHLLFVGTGGPSPFALSARGTNRGDELFSNSIVALDPDTGKYVWHYQVTNDDIVNYEAIETITVTDLPVDGKMRRVILQAPKNGFFFVLDAKTGKFISAKNYVPVNWTTGYDPITGRAPWRAEAQWWKLPGKRVTMFPGIGAHGVQPMSFSPLTRLAYIPAIDMGMDYLLSAGAGGYRDMELNPSLHADTGRAPLIAWDPITQKERWRIDHPMPLNGGVLSTGGNLVFEGLGTGEVEAYRADSGQRLWSFQTNAGIAAAPVTVKIDGRQLLLVSVGNGGSTMLLRGYRALWNAPVRNATPRLLAFEIGGQAPLPPVPPLAPLPKPVVSPPTPATVGRGASLFDANCAACHGQQTLAIRGAIPDLRRSPVPASFAALREVVIGGARVALGMPKFELTEAELHQIQAYIIRQSWASYDAQLHGTELQPDWK